MSNEPMPGNDDAGAHRAMIELRQVHKWYGQFHVLKDVNLEVQKG